MDLGLFFLSLFLAGGGGGNGGRRWIGRGSVDETKKKKEKKEKKEKKKEEMEEKLTPFLLQDLHTDYITFRI
jgi:hypothetical protein